MVGRRGVLLVFGCVLSGLALTGSGAPQAVATDCTASSPARGGSGQGVPVDPASLTTAELQDLALMAEQTGSRSPKPSTPTAGTSPSANW